VLRFYLILFCCLSSISCSSTSTVNYEPVCFDTEDEARKVGRDSMDNGFNNRVSHWVTGDSAITIPSLGLLKGGFNPEPYCPDGGYPILITFDSKNSDLDSDNDLRWAKTVINAMIREEASETYQKN